MESNEKSSSLNSHQAAKQDLFCRNDGLSDGQKYLADDENSALAKSSEVNNSAGVIDVAGDLSESRFVSGKDNIVGDNNTIIFGNQDLPKQKFSSQKLNGLYLERISIDIQSIQSINASLEAVNKVLETGFLSQEDESHFHLVKEEIQALNLYELNSKLEAIAAIAKNLLDVAKRVLLTRDGTQLLDPDSLDCIDQQLEIMQTLQIELEYASELADWLDDNRERIAKRAGRESLKCFLEIQSRTSQKQVGHFCFSLNQFLEQLAHCLRWGRANILDSPGIPLELDISVYAEAFQLIKRDLPSHISEEAKSQFEEYVDYLIERLPSYA